MLTGPDMQYSSEKPLTELRIDVYAGRDGRFTLYEDEGTTYDYERGFCSFIPIAYNEVARTLTVGKRKGSFPSMTTDKTISVVLHTVEGTELVSSAEYSGDSIVIRF